MLQQTKDRYRWLLRSMKLALWTGLITVLGSQTGFADKALKLDYVGYYGGLEAVRVDVSITPSGRPLCGHQRDPVDWFSGLFVIFSLGGAWQGRLAAWFGSAFFFKVGV
jgi:hypothetical protein